MSITRSDLAIHLISTLGSHPQPPLVILSCLLVARHPNATHSQLSMHVGGKDLNQSLRNGEKRGLITAHRQNPKGFYCGERNRYRLTPEGEKVVRDILLPKPTPVSQA